MTAALEQASVETIEYSEDAASSPVPRRAHFEAIPPTPASVGSESDLDARMAALLAENEELKRQADDELQVLQAQASRRVELAEEQREAAEQKALAALEREQLAQQRCLEAEERLAEGEAARRALVEQQRAATAGATHVAVSTAVEAEAHRWRVEIQGMQVELDKALLERSRLQEEASRRSQPVRDETDEHQASRKQADDSTSSGETLSEESSAPSTLELQAKLERSSADLLAALSEGESARRAVDELHTCLRCLSDELVFCDDNATSVHRAFEECAALREQSQRSLDAASEHLQSSTREAANRVREAEQRAEACRLELDDLRRSVEAERAGSAAALKSDSQRREAEAEVLATLRNERDTAVAALSKSRAELEALRVHLLDHEEASSQREALLTEAQTQKTEHARQSAESEARAVRAERSLAEAQQRDAERALALSNLQTVLEQMQLQTAGPGEDLAELRIGGRLLVDELRLCETQAAAALATSSDALSLRASLRAEQAASVHLQEEVAGLKALLRAASGEREQDASIDKRLVSSVLVKYFERDCSHEVLAVLASMLGCTREEQQVVGLLPRDTIAPAPDAKLADVWTDFLLQEAGDEASRRVH